MDIEYQKAAKHYSVSHMSNTKWRKLFLCWARSGIEIEHSEWSFLDSEHKEIHRLPCENDLMENRFSDGQFQPFEYKWILTIYIPKNYKPISKVGFERKQNIEGLKEISKSFGNFPIFEKEDGIEIRGYEK